MTVKELIAELEKLPDWLDVYVDIDEPPQVVGAFLTESDDPDYVSRAVLLEVYYPEIEEPS